MTEFVLGFLTAWVVTWPGIIGLCVLGIIFEHTYHRGWAIVAGIAALIASYVMFHISIETLAYSTVGYFVVGVLWSIYRYKKFVRASLLPATSFGLSPSDVTHKLKRLHPMMMVDTLVAWIIIWPFSLVECSISDILDTIQLLVTKVFRNVYIKIWENAVAEMNK